MKKNYINLLLKEFVQICVIIISSFISNEGPGAMVYVPEFMKMKKKSMFYLTVNNLINAVDDLNKNELEGAADVMKQAIVKSRKIRSGKRSTIYYSRF